MTLYSHDTYGLGHLRRNLAIAEHLLRGKTRFHVRLLTGSPVAGEWTFPADLEVTALPPVVKIGVETYAARDSDLPFTLVKAYREALIVKAIVTDPPDILLVDHSPAGMNGELMASLAFIKRELPATKVVIGLRDVIDSPEAVREIWRRQHIADLLKELYDLILVYGSRELFDLEQMYQMPPKLAAKVRYCGYVARPYAPAAAHPPGERPTVLVTAGGGEDGFTLMDGYLRCLRRLPTAAVRSLIVTGPLMSDADRGRLETAAAGLADIEFVSATQDLPALLQHADLVVAMGGYNTSMEIIASGKPAILAPRTTPRVEQAMRAELFERLGLVRRALPGPEFDRRLAHLMREALAQGNLGERHHRLDMNGAARVAELFSEMVAGQAREACA